MMRAQSAKRLAAAALCLSLLSATGCDIAEKPTSAAQTQDLLSLRPPQKNKIPVTVLVKYAFSINGFEQAAEAKFPQLDIIQVPNFTQDRGIAEYTRRMEHDDLTDIVMTWPLDAGAEYCEERLLDLSGMPFAGNYLGSMLSSLSKDGKLYYLPGPAQVRGIIYNKTLFEENGWEVPTDYEGFRSLCAEIERTGIRALQLGFANGEVLDTAFDGFSYGTTFSSPNDAQALEDFNDGKTSFGNHFSAALDTFEQMRDDGIWKKSDLSVFYQDREKMMATRNCAMVEDSVLLCRILNTDYGSTDEFALMPFFSPGEESDWARIYMVCYIGLNRHLAEPANKQKYDLVMELMHYISSPEGQDALAADTGAMFSSVKGQPPPNIPEIDDLRATLEAGRYAIFPELKNAQSALRQGLRGLLDGTMTKAEVIAAVDAQNQAPNAAANTAEIGTATETFTLAETGAFVADAMRAHANADIALILDVGKDGLDSKRGVAGKLYQGVQTELDALRIIQNPVTGETGTLVTARMTGKNLVHALAYTLGTPENPANWFYYFSGLRMELFPFAPLRDRIGNLTDANGNAIDPNKVYTVAIMDGSVPDSLLAAQTDSNILVTDVIEDAIRNAGTVSPPKDGRLRFVF